MAVVGTIELPSDLPAIDPLDIDRDNDLPLVWDASAGRLKTVTWPRITVGENTVNAQDYGADPNGFSAGPLSNTALNDSVVAAGANGRVWFPAGAYHFENGCDPITSTMILGDGENQTRFNYSATKDDEILLDFVQSQTAWGLRDIMIQGVTTADLYNKTAVRVTDSSQGKLENVKIRNWRGPGTDSVGVEWRGREETEFNGLTIFANAPIVFDDNPNNDRDCDNVVFRDVYCIVEDTVDPLGPLVKIPLGTSPETYISSAYGTKPGSSFTPGNLRLLGKQEWAGQKLSDGGGGFYHAPTGTPVSSIIGRIIIQHSNGEQRNSGQWHIYIDPMLNGVGGTLSSFHLIQTNVPSDVDPDTGGVYVRGVNSTLIEGFTGPNNSGTTIFDFDPADAAFGSFEWIGAAWHTGNLAAQINNNGSGILDDFALVDGYRIPVNARWLKEGSTT